MEKSCSNFLVQEKTFTKTEENLGRVLLHWIFLFFFLNTLALLYHVAA